LDSDRICKLRKALPTLLRPAARDGYELVHGEFCQGISQDERIKEGSRSSEFPAQLNLLHTQTILLQRRVESPLQYIPVVRTIGRRDGDMPVRDRVLSDAKCDAVTANRW